MSWLQLREKSLADLVALYPSLNRYLKMGFQVVPNQCQDGAVALSKSVNQVLLVDLETGDLSNLEICA